MNKLNPNEFMTNIVKGILEIPDNHEEELKQVYDDKMLEDAEDVLQEEKENYFNNQEQFTDSDIK